MDNESAANIWQHAPKLQDRKSYVEYDGIYETKCLALLQSAKHRLDLQEAALRVRIPNEEVVDNGPHLRVEQSWYKGSHN